MKKVKFLTVALIVLALAGSVSAFDLSVTPMVSSGVQFPDGPEKSTMGWRLAGDVNVFTDSARAWGMCIRTGYYNQVPYTLDTTEARESNNIMSWFVVRKRLSTSWKIPVDLFFGVGGTTQIVEGDDPFRGGVMAGIGLHLWGVGIAPEFEWRPVDGLGDLKTVWMTINMLPQ